MPLSRSKRRNGASAAKSNTAIATTDTASARGAYVGRFAPSPTGDLHLGSLYTAVASFLDARAHGGRWLLRIEDVDRPREVPGSAAGIVSTLEAFGFEWDGDIVRQANRSADYVRALDQLHSRGLIFECSCSRLDLADEERYPGNCRERPLNPGPNTAIRLRVDPGHVQFTDRIQGIYRQDVAQTVGDLMLRRRGQWFAYLLAVVVDDASQGVTHVVRGADLLDNTPRQIYLQQRLGLPTPLYAHVPVLVEADGGKLAKSARSVRLDCRAALPQLLSVFELLGLKPPGTLASGTIGAAWDWAREHWQLNRVPKGLILHLAC